MSTTNSALAQTTTTFLNNAANNVEYASVIQQQTDGALVRKKVRSMIKEMTALRKQQSNQYKQWSAKWARSFRQNQSSLEIDEDIRQLLTDAGSIGDDIAEQLDHSNEILENIYQSILKEDASSSLKFEFQQARSKADQADRDLAELETRRIQLENRLDRTQKEIRKDSLSDYKRTEMKARERLVSGQLKGLKTQIKTQEETCRQAHEIYRDEAEKIYRQGQEDELRRLRSLQDPLTDFIQALKIEPASLEQPRYSHELAMYLTQRRQKFSFS